jgi:hypothetical protein
LGKESAPRQNRTKHESANFRAVFESFHIGLSHLADFFRPASFAPAAPRRRVIAGLLCAPAGTSATVGSGVPPGFGTVPAPDGGD